MAIVQKLYYIELARTTVSKTTYFRKGEWYISTSASYTAPREGHNTGGGSNHIDKVDTGFGGLFEAERDVQAITDSGAHKKKTGGYLLRLVKTASYHPPGS
jgi:hypothetical protein